MLCVYVVLNYTLVGCPCDVFNFLVTNGSSCTTVQREDSRILCRFLIFWFKQRQRWRQKLQISTKIGRGLLGEKNFQRESEATLSARDFSCPVTGSTWPARYCYSWLRPSVGRRSLGQRPTPKHPARRTRGTTSRTQGSQSLTTNLVILLRQDAFTTRVLGCKNPVRLNLLCLFVISDKSAISFKDLSA